MLAEVQRLCNRSHEQDVIESNWSLVVQESTFACTSLPLLHNFRSPFVLPRVDFKTQNYFRVCTRFPEIVFVDLRWNRAKSDFPVIGISARSVNFRNASGELNHHRKCRPTVVIELVLTRDKDDEITIRIYSGPPDFSCDAGYLAGK